MDAIRFYQKDDPYFQFSNFYPAEIQFYHTAEHYYQSMKYDYTNADQASLDYADLIIDQNTPNKAFILANQKKKNQYPWQVELTKIIGEYQAKNIKIRPDWDRIKDNIMRRVVYIKFYIHPELKELLCNTDTKYLVENSPRDDYWGIGGNKDGQNKLGYILMETRFLLCGVTNLKIPSDFSNWVIPNHLIMGANPGQGIDDSGRPGKWKTDLATHYILFGVDTFISLQEEIPGNPYIPYPVSGVISVNNHSFKKHGKVWAHNFPIADQKVAEDHDVLELAKTIIQLIATGRKIFLHCERGKGRAGTVISVFLGILYRLSAKSAMKLARFIFNTRKDKGNYPHISQTQVQKDQVSRILDTDDDHLRDPIY